MALVFHSGRNMSCAMGEKGSCSILWSGSRLLIQSLCCSSFRTWSSYGPLSRGDSQSFHLLSSRELTVGSSFIHSFIWEGDRLSLRIHKQSLSLCICIQAAPWFSFQELQPSEHWGSAGGPASSHPTLTVAGLKARSSRMSSPGLRKVRPAHLLLAFMWDPLGGDG